MTKIATSEPPSARFDRADRCLFNPFWTCECLKHPKHKLFSAYSTHRCGALICSVALWSIKSMHPHPLSCVFCKPYIHTYTIIYIIYCIHAVLFSRVADNPHPALYHSSKDHFRTFTNLIIHVPSSCLTSSGVVADSKLVSGRLEHQKHELTSWWSGLWLSSITALKTKKFCGISRFSGCYQRSSTGFHFGSGQLARW